MCRANFYVNVEKLLCFIDYWILFKLLELLRGSYYILFNLKAGNVLATSSTFLPEVFKPQTDELFVESLIDKSRKSSYFSRGILN